MIEPFFQKVLKPWGYEILLTPVDSMVTGKIAFTKTGQRWSLQYHDRKDETITLINGEAELLLENNENQIEKIKMELQKGYHIQPYRKHRFCAITDCTSLEISTPEIGNTVRLEDDYSRGTETEEKRKEREEGKIYTG